MEDPDSKGLVSQVSLTMEPDSQYQFIVVLKSPVKRKSALFYTDVTIKTDSRPGENLSVFCFGSMEIPRMVCPKEIWNQELGYSSLKVIMRRNMAYTPIKVLLSNNGDMPVEAQFMNIEVGE